MNKSLLLCVFVIGFMTIIPTHKAHAQFYTPYVTRKEVGSLVAAQPTTAEGLVATGSKLTDALALTATENTVTDVSTGSAVKLKDVPVGSTITIFNRASGSVSIFPTSATDQIESYGAGVAFVLEANGTVEFHRTSATQWRIKP